MTETNVLSYFYGFLVFAAFLVGGGLFISTSFDSYNIEDTNTLNSQNITGLQDDMQGIIDTMEESQDTAKAGNEDTGDNPLKAVGKIYKKLEDIKIIKEVGSKILKNTLNFIPSFIWWLLLAAISITIIYRMAALWFGKS